MKLENWLKLAKEELLPHVDPSFLTLISQFIIFMVNYLKKLKTSKKLVMS